MHPLSQSLWHIKHHAWGEVVGIIFFKYLNNFHTVRKYIIHICSLHRPLKPVSVTPLERGGNMCIYKKFQTPALSYLAVESIHLLFFFFISKHETPWQTWNIFNSGINPLSIFYRRNGVHFTFWEKKWDKKLMYLEYLNIGVHVNALHNHWFWFDIRWSPLIAQNTHNALTTVFWLRKRHERTRSPQARLCWPEVIITAGSDRKTLVSGGVRGEMLLLLSVFIYGQAVKICLYRKQPFWTSVALNLGLEHKWIVYIKKT